MCTSVQMWICSHLYVLAQREYKLLVFWLCMVTLCAIPGRYIFLACFYYTFISCITLQLLSFFSLMHQTLIFIIKRETNIANTHNIYHNMYVQCTSKTFYITQKGSLKYFLSLVYTIVVKIEPNLG